MPSRLVGATVGHRRRPGLFPPDSVSEENAATTADKHPSNPSCGGIPQQSSTPAGARRRRSFFSWVWALGSALLLLMAAAWILGGRRT